MPPALYQEVSTTRTPMCFWVHSTHNNALKNTKVTNKCTVTTELHTYSISNLFPFRHFSLTVIKDHHAVSVSVFMHHTKDVNQVTSVIICFPWLCTQLTAMSQFRKVFKSALSEVNSLFWVDKDAFNIFCCCHYFFQCFLFYPFPFMAKCKLAFPASTWKPKQACIMHWPPLAP